MSQLVIFYTFTGKCKKIADQKAAELGAELLYVREQKNRSKIGAFVTGCRAAMRQVKSPLAPITVDLTQFDKYTVICPIWAGYPAPAFNSIIAMLPADKQLDLIFASGSGQSAKGMDKIKALLTEKNIRLNSISEIKA